MRYPNPFSALGALLLNGSTATIPAEGAPQWLAGSYYTDVNPGIQLRGAASPNGYQFGMILPQNPTTDLIAQIITPLGAGGSGWGGVSLGSSMRGPLLLVTWANGDKVMTAARMATDYSAIDVVPYPAHPRPVTISPIAQGTFINDTHVSSTFLCGGCINSDSFDPAWAGAESSSGRDVFFGWACSQTAVEDPADIDTRLSDHTVGAGGGHGTFRVELGDTKSDDYNAYAAMAMAMAGADEDGAGSESPAPTTTEVPPAPTDMDGGGGCSESECEVPSGADFSHREMPPKQFYALTILGVVYLGQAFLP